MTREKFFDALVWVFVDTDIEYEELLDDDGEGGVYIKFTNVEAEEEVE